MLRVSIVEARPGMMLGADIAHPNVTGGRLLRAGAELDERCIAKLAELGVREVWIHYPGLEHLARYHDPRTLAAHRRLVSQLALVLDGALVQPHVELDYWAYRKAVVGVLDSIMQNPAAAVLAGDVASGDQPFVRHSGQVCMLSLLMALKLEFYLILERPRLAAPAAKDITPLGVGAMLHDIGLTKIHPEALRRWNLTPDEADEAWRAHAQLGFAAVTDQIDPAAAGVVLHHHQYFDGLGFPARRELGGKLHPLRGSEIHVFARIVACAELFSRLRHPAHAPGSDDRVLPPRPVVAALHDLVRGPWRQRVDPVILRALVTVIPPFAPGTLVTISDGRRAAVIDSTPLNPCRPTVEVIDPTLAQSRQRRGDPVRERIDLRTTPEVSITEAEGHDVAPWLFAPQSPEEFDLSRVARSLTNRAHADLAERPDAA